MGSVDVCDVCGFSESVYNEADAASTAELARLIVDAALEGLTEEQAKQIDYELDLTGENITVSGIDWASLRPGSQMVIGDVPVLITAHATPCSKIASSFADRDSNRILHGKHRGWSRLYAQPLAEGTIEIGDPITS